MTTTTMKLRRNSITYSNGITTNNNRTRTIKNEAGDIDRNGGGENIAIAPDGRVVADLYEIITTEPQQGTEKSTEERPYRIKSIKKTESNRWEKSNMNQTVNGIRI